MPGKTLQIRFNDRRPDIVRYVRTNPFKISVNPVFFQFMVQLRVHQVCPTNHAGDLGMLFSKREHPLDLIQACICLDKDTASDT